MTIDLNLFDFDLPDSAIALSPARPRDSARLLVVPANADLPPVDRQFSSLPDLLRPGDLLVVNKSRVIPAVLQGKRIGRGDAVSVSLTLHEQIEDRRWWAFCKGSKKIKQGDRIAFAPGFEALVFDKRKDHGDIGIVFTGDRSVDEALEQLGSPPLPPYILKQRPLTDQDRCDYQTVYADDHGSVAAPTAGLHFTRPLLNRLKEKNISILELTLHVGAGTFLPIRTDIIRKNRLHAEYGEIPEQTAHDFNIARHEGRRIIAVGTTSLRLLESACDKKGFLRPFSGQTSIFIRPGHRFTSVNGLITNFHLPRSSLFILVCAFSGRLRIQQVYSHALEHGYRFYSYGDSSLLWKNEGKKAS